MVNLVETAETVLDLADILLAMKKSHESLLLGITTAQLLAQELGIEEDFGKSYDLLDELDKIAFECYNNLVNHTPDGEEPEEQTNDEPEPTGNQDHSEVV